MANEESKWINYNNNILYAIKQKKLVELVLINQLILLLDECYEWINK